jgi:hypothetical protein
MSAMMCVARPTFQRFNGNAARVGSTRRRDLEISVPGATGDTEKRKLLSVSVSQSLWAVNPGGLPMAQDDQSRPFEYTIPAIPTRYRGRLYRSRLEARWAAFFDLMSWEHEYEPFDLNGWIPDFLLRGTWPNGRRAEVLVEVKPVSTYDRDVGLKVLNACVGTDWQRSLDILLLGVSPWRHFHGLNGIVLGVNVGWSILPARHPDGETAEPLACCVNDYEAPLICFADSSGLRFDIGPGGRPITGMLTRYDTFYDTHNPKYFRANLLDIDWQRLEWVETIERLWAEATNRVQWRGQETQS